MKRLYLGGNVRLGDEGAKALAIALARPGAAPLLECLELRCCGIGDEGAAALAEHALRLHPRLRRLDLGRNPELGARGAAAIGRALSVPHCRLEALDLRHCGVGDKGASALAAAVGSGHARHLKALHLASNGIGPAGARALARGLAHVATHPRRGEVPKVVVVDGGGDRHNAGPATKNEPEETAEGAGADGPSGSKSRRASGGSGWWDWDAAEDEDGEDGLMYLDLSGNFIEGKAKADEKVKARLSKTLSKVSGLMGKVSHKMGGVGEILEKGLSEADKQLAPKKLPTKAGGSGALAKAILTKPPGGVTLRKLGLSGCGLEPRHIRLLERATIAAAADRAAFLGYAHDKIGDGRLPERVSVDTRLNIPVGRAAGEKVVPLCPEDNEEAHEAPVMELRGKRNQRRSSPTLTRFTDDDEEDDEYDENDSEGYDDGYDEGYDDDSDNAEEGDISEEYDEDPQDYSDDEADEDLEDFADTDDEDTDYVNEHGDDRY